MVKKVRASREVLSDAAVGSVALCAIATALEAETTLLGTSFGIGAITVGGIWLLVRLANELFWLRALSRPAAAAKKMARSGAPNRRSLLVLKLVLAAQQEVVRARGDSSTRSD